MGQAPLQPEEGPKIDMRKYKQRNIQLSEADVLHIKHLFDTLEPVDGYVNLNDVYKLYSQSLDREIIEKNFSGKSRINFDEFFEVMGGLMVEKKHRFKNIEFESSVKNVSCFYCPYPSDTSKKNESFNAISI